MSGGYRWLILGSSAALGACAGSSGLFETPESYHALGHNPGWLLTMENTSLRFVTSSPNTVIESIRPVALATSLGQRYSSERITLDIMSQPCNDALSGIAFSDTVVVSANGHSYRGCGGERTPLLDR